MSQFAIRPEVAQLQPYVAGRAVADVLKQFGISGAVKLASNENPLGPSPQALQAIGEAAADLNRYPDVSAGRLREALGAGPGLSPEWVLVGNGSDEILRLLAATFLRAGDICVVPECSFPNYRAVATLFGARVAAVPLRQEAMDLGAMAAAGQGARLIFLCRPNNPTGAVFAEPELQEFLAEVPERTLVVLDQAYNEFDRTVFDSMRFLRSHPNLVLTRTFSKAYGLAGLRVGYGLAHPEVWEAVRRVREPFSVNALAQVAALAALADSDHLERTLRNNRAGLAELEAGLQALGVAFVPSQANFVMADLRRPAADIAVTLLSRGVIVRDCGPFGRPNWIRVSVGTPDQVALFLEALSHVL